MKKAKIKKGCENKKATIFFQTINLVNIRSFSVLSSIDSMFGFYFLLKLRRIFSVQYIFKLHFERHAMPMWMVAFDNFSKQKLKSHNFLFLISFKIIRLDLLAFFSVFLNFVRRYVFVRSHFRNYLIWMNYWIHY